MGDFRLRIVNLEELARIERVFADVRKKRELTPACRSDIESALRGLEQEHPSDQWYRKACSRDLQAVLDPALKPTNLKAALGKSRLLHVVERELAFIDFKFSSDDVDEEPPSLVILADEDGGLFDVLSSAAPIIQELITEWPEPILEHEEGSMMVIRGPRLEALDAEMRRLSQNLDWIKGRLFITQREDAHLHRSSIPLTEDPKNPGYLLGMTITRNVQRATVVFGRLCRLVARARSNPAWAIAWETSV